MNRLQKVAVFFIFCVVTQSASADKSSALNWLSVQGQQSGAISMDTDIATSGQSTSEAILALNELQGVEIESTLSEGIQFLTNADLQKSSTEQISQIIRIKVLRGENFDSELTNLLLRRSKEGGFSDYPGDSSTVLSTSFALQALADVNYPIDQGTIGFLINAQNSSGAWLFPEQGDPSVVLTAYAMSALWRYRGQLAVNSYLDVAQTYLESQKNLSTQLWSDSEASALALNALAQRLVDRSSITASVNALISQQLPNGSFEGDVYVTSLVVQLLQTLEKPALDAIQVTGTVVDADSGAALSSVAIKLDGAESFETSTDITGKFTLSPTSAGQYLLTISLDGYSEVVLNTMLVTGNQLSMGDIALNKLAVDPETGEPVVTGTVRGAIKSRLTNAPLEGVVVSINGDSDLTTITDANGEYQISNVAPGNISISAVLAGYQTASGTADLQERQTLVFSPLLTKALSSNVSVSGTVTDNDSGQPLEGVTIVATQNGSPFQATSGVDGSYVLNDIPQGLIEISASLAGYVAVSGSVDAPAGANISFSPSLVLEGNPPADDQASIQGLIVDSATGRGLDGVTLAITYTLAGQTLTFNTDADGNVDIPNLDSGTVSLEISLSGYRTQIVTFDLQPGFGIDLGTVELEPDVPQDTADVSGRLVDLRTNQPILNGIVSFRNNGVLIREVMSDVDGLFTANMIDLGDVTVSISRQGYVATEFVTNIGNPSDIDLGDIRLRPEGVDQLLPDLTVLSIDTSAATSDGQTFNIDGTLTLEFANRGNALAVGGFRVVAFDDVNNDGVFDTGDVVLGEVSHGEAVAVEESVSLNIPVSGVQRFRDAPVSVSIDVSNFIAELSEDNNVGQSQGECSRQSNVKVDLALCLDSSGSVSGSEFNLQLEGTAQALENPDIVARDGSVRATVIQFASRSQVELSPTVITEGNIESVVNEIRTIRKRGGGTSIHSCIDTARSQIVTANQVSPSLSQVIDVSTDGQSSFSSAVAASTRAQEAGIDVLNSIGVGSGVNLNLLNSIVFPQPVGGERGFVVTTKNFQEYIDAISIKIAKETKVVDLTAGKLELATAGDQVSLSLIVGNSGSGDISETVIVRFYDGDPAQGGVEIGSVEHQTGIVSGGHLTLSIGGLVASQINAGAVFAIAEFVNSVAECTSGNNQTSVGVISDAGTIDLTLDKTQYEAGESVQFVSTVTNTGLFVGEYQVDTIIRDVLGNEVARFNNQMTGSVEPSNSEALSDVWPVGQSLAGDFTVESLLYNSAGELIDQDQASFTVVSDSQVLVSIRTTTDRIEYNTNGQVEISDLVRNLSTNAIQPNAQLLVTVSDPSGVEVYQNTSLLGDLTPSFSQIVPELFQLNNAVLGIYTATGTILDESGQLLATDSTEFNVDLILEVAVNGEVTVSAEQVFQGETLDCFDLVLNTTTTNIDDLQLRQLVVAIDSEQVILSDESSNTLAASAELNLSRGVETSGYELGNYACALQAFVNNEWVTLDSEFFEVLEPPIKISLEINAGQQGSVLILLDDVQSYSTRGSEPDLATQRAYLETLLTQTGWHYTIVTSGDDFVQELQTGQYINYLLLSEAEKISEQGQKELREAIFRGEGLIEAGSHDQRQGRVDDALGVKFKGKSNKPQGVSLFESEITQANNLSLSIPDTVLTGELDGATKIAEYIPDLAKGNKEAAPAITDYAYGQGQSVYFGFDVLAEATLLNAYDSVFDQLILSALGHINNPDMLNQPGTIKQVRIMVNNEQQATPARLTVTLPSVLTIHDAPDGTIADDSVSWLFDLDEEEVVTVALWVSQSTDESTLTALVESGEEPQWVVQDEISFTLTQEDEISLLAVLASLPSDKAWKQVRQALERAQGHILTNNLTDALRELLKASDRIEQSDLPDSEESRVQIAQLIRQTEQNLTELANGQ